ncbi:MAG: BREX-2 system phosphatase PglZ [Vicinamibacterales bacterium]
MLPPTPAQVRQHVAELRRRKIRDARVVLLHGDGWNGPDLLEVEDTTYRVVATTSPLHVREELVELPDGMGLVVVTPLDERELGGDVVARAARRRVMAVDPWDIVRDLFRARDIDPQVATARWMAEALVELAPQEGYPPAPSGLLNADTVWDALLTRGLGLTDGRPDALAIAQWSEAEGAPERYRALSPALREGVRSRVHATAGTAGLAMLDALEVSPPQSVIVLGLACRVLFSRTDDRALADAAIRFERFHRQHPLAPEVGRLWAEAAERVLAGLEHGKKEPAVRSRAERADRLLSELGAGAHLHASDWSPEGLEQRLEQFGRAILASFSDANACRDVESSADALLGHRLLSDAWAGVRRGRVEMARRLVRWLQRPAETFPTRLVDAVAHYRLESSFTDFARLVLLGGEQPAVLGDAYAALLSRARERREQENERFGRLLADAAASPPEGTNAIVPVERVIDRVVAPVAERQPVLLLVMDGLSLAVAHELLASITSAGWTQWRPDLGGPDAPLTGLAAVPSITEVSRTSLFCGGLVLGAAADEKREFAAHQALTKVSSSRRPPVLFHKGDLLASSGRGLSTVVRDAVTSPDQQVVGVVVNVVDDLLFKGDQSQPHWTLHTAPLLPELFEAARMAGRAVVLTSDHGHLLDDDSAFQGREAGERWREDAGEPGEGEVRVQGRRVPGRASVIVPWSERTRYGAKRNGYHGGLSPQEMVLPLTVLTWGEEGPGGFVADTSLYPLWWHEVAEAPTAERVTRLMTPPKPKARPLLDLAEPEVAQVRADALPTVLPWIEGLFASPRYQEQKAMTPERSRPQDGEVRRLLVVLADRGGRMTNEALAHHLGLPVFRLASLVAATRRLLNVDGSPVLDVELASQTVILNNALLIQQFELTTR